ncbi:hypothetical protein A8L34_27995 [Bacillus sp. FJAT-27264]|uniref:VirD4-like conjugal transfer protein, CD1115 family n=1 Tax=Paenibacillus sp. (strain DSM 101736 / FJAT-27264) TaxID=1850362 RepID=UPI0008081324|nr:type IV secretory system conjugative DNA transfer family protein [Bacillus sp. FJAT-27264]OBZ15891.1 hypothetical protein A8L34_27995 [Bacillus sp. FJAT-27264]
MSKRLIVILLSMLLLLPIHFYVTGSAMALWKITDETSWKSPRAGEPSPVRIRAENWLTYWVKQPSNTLDKMLHPQNEFQKDTQKRMLWATPFIYLILYYNLIFRKWRKRKFDNASKYGSHGSSRWAKKKEIFRLGEMSKRPVNERNGPGVIIGYLINESRRNFINDFRRKYVTLPPDSEYNQNFIVYGGSGIGKSYTWVKTQILNTILKFVPKDSFKMLIRLFIVRALGPIGKIISNRLNWPAVSRKKDSSRRKLPSEYSLVVVDPKGENYEDTAGILEKNGYEVVMVNLIDLWLSANWNALDYVRDPIEAEKLSATIISNSSLGHRGGGDPFWERAENALLASLILFVKFELPEEDQNLTNVLSLILTVGNDELLLNAMFDNLPFNHPSKMKFKIFAFAEEKTRTGILIGFSSHLQLWTNQSVQDLTSHSSFKLGDLGQRKMALFLVIPDADKTFKSVTSLLFAQIFQELWTVARKYGDTLPVGVRLIMDEFANIGYVPDFAERMSVMRSKGISAQIILQTRSQLDNLYKESADIIAAACDTTVFLGTNDDKTAESMSKTLGDMTIKVQSVSNDPGKITLGDKNISEQYQQRKLMDASEIKRSSRKINIIVQNGAYPFKTQKTPYTEHELYKDYEKRPVANYKAQSYKQYSFFDFEEFLATAGVYQSAMEKEENPEIEISDSTHQSDVLSKIYGDSGEVQQQVATEIQTSEAVHENLSKVSSQDQHKQIYEPFEVPYEERHVAQDKLLKSLAETGVSLEYAEHKKASEDDMQIFGEELNLTITNPETLQEEAMRLIQQQMQEHDAEFEAEREARKQRMAQYQQPTPSPQEIVNISNTGNDDESISYESLVEINESESDSDSDNSNPSPTMSSLLDDLY